MSDEYVKEIKGILGRIEQLAVIGSKTILTLSEAAAFTGYSTSHLYAMTSKRLVPHYKKCRKLYFRKQELEEWMLEREVKPESDIDSMAATYIATHHL